MPDKKSDAVLAMLSDKVGYTYKVVKKQELANAVPKKYRITTEKFADFVTYLKERDYVTVKYQDKDEICLALTLKAANYLSESNHSAERQTFSAKQFRLLFAAVFAAAFLGALTAEILSKLL